VGLKAVATTATFEAFAALNAGGNKRKKAGSSPPWRNPCNVNSLRGSSVRKCRWSAHRNAQIQRGGHEGYITVGMYEDGRPGESSSRCPRGLDLSGVRTTWR